MLLLFKLRDLLAWCLNTPASSSALCNQECKETAAPAATALLPHLHNAHGSISTGEAVGLSGWWEAVKQLPAPHLPKQNPLVALPTGSRTVQQGMLGWLQCIVLDPPKRK